MSEIKKHKLVYILPEFKKNIGSHFYHKYEFLKRASGELDLFVILERGERPPDLPNVYVGKMYGAPLRALELFILLFVLRIRGYRTFWTHYSFYGAILAPLFGRSFYWNCGMPWLYERSVIQEFFFRLALKRSLLVTGTEGLKKMYAEKYNLLPKRIFVLPNWIHLARFFDWSGRQKEARQLLGIPIDTKVVLFLHRLSKRKGADLIKPVAEAFEGRALFVVAGGGPLAGTIAGPNIRHVGEIPQEDVPKYLAAADVFFMPSEEEGFPHVILEAMAVGIPIVATNVGGMEEIVPTGLSEFIVDRDTAAFVERIEILLSQKEVGENIVEQEKTWVSQYSLENVLDAFLKLIGVRNSRDVSLD